MTIHEQQGQPSGADSSVGQLVERLSAQVSALVRDEMALATAEMKRKGAQAGVGIGIGSAGAVVALLGLGALGETAQALVHKADVPTRAKQRGNELKEEAIERGSELGHQVLERGSELRDQVVDAAERAREAVSQTPRERWAKLVAAGLTLIALSVIVRRVRTT